MIIRCVNMICLGAGCAFLMHVLMPDSKQDPCSLPCSLLEHNWFKQLSRGRQTKRSYKAEKAALGAGHYAISEKQGKWTLAGKEKVWMKPKYFLALWSFVFCKLLGCHICLWLTLEHQHLLAWWWVNISWSIFMCCRLTQWQCAVLVLHIGRLVFSPYGCAETLSHRPQWSLDSSDTSVCPCTVSGVQVSRAIWSSKGAVAVFTQNLCEIVWLSS